MKKNSSPYHIELILKFLEGKSTVAEDRELDEWIRQSPENPKLFEEIRSSWDSSPEHTPRALHAYKAIAARLDIPDGSAIPESRRTLFPGRRFIRMAAVFAGFLVVTFFVYQSFFKTSGTTYRTGYAEVSTFYLPDSSLVTLNANSRLTLAENWLEQPDRRVSLQGEAFFEITRKPDNSGSGNGSGSSGPGNNSSSGNNDGSSGNSAPRHSGPGDDGDEQTFKKFIVTTDNLEVEVLGTTFNVNSRNSETKVTLNSGSIRLKLFRDNREILMQPGDFVAVESSEQPVIRKGIDAENYSTWKNGQLYFDGSTIDEIQELLLHNYKIEIYFEDPEEVTDVRLRGTFPSDKLELLLKAIADVTHTEKVEQGDRIYYQEKDKQE